MAFQKKKYTHIFFDLDNTLWNFDENSYHALHAAFDYFEIQKQEIDFNQFFSAYSIHNKSLWEAYRQKKVVKNELKELRFLKTFADLKIAGIDANKMNEFYLSEMPGQNRLVEGAKDLLDYLKSKGYYMYIITNGFKEVQHKKLETSGITDYFQKIFISEEIKAPKPDRKIFEYAIKSANAPKQKSLMVGDNFEIDVKGALNFEIDAVFYNPSLPNIQLKENIAKYGRNIYYEVSSLNELVDLL